MQKDQYPFRGIACTKEEATTFCWGVTEPKGALKRLYFKLPPLLDNEVRVKVLYVGLCHSDCSRTDGEMGKNYTYPLVPGHEIVAGIEKLGALVKGLAVGDIVALGPFRDCCGVCEFCTKGKDHLCEDVPYKSTFDPYIGGFSTHMNVNSKFLFSLPEKIPIARAAPILCAGVSVFAPLKRWGAPGLRCGIVGIGGLGHLAIQFASKMGMEVVAISSSAAKEKDTLHFGAREFVWSKNEAAMKKLIAKSKLDLAINTSYLHNLTEYVAAVKPGGCFVQTAAPDVSKPVYFSNLDLVAGEKVFAGSLAGSRKSVMETLEFCQNFEVYPVVETFTWAEFPKAFEILREGASHYRCVVDVAGTFDGL